MGRKFKDVFKSEKRYLGKEDLDEPVLAVIEAIREETVKGEFGDEDKPILHFRDGLKPMVLNKTNGEILRDSFGDDIDLWYGKAVEVYVDPNVMYAGQRKGGLRIRTDVKKSMTLDEAVEACAEVNISKDELIARLKELGRTGYNGDRDTPAVNGIIEQAKLDLDAVSFD